MGPRRFSTYLLLAGFLLVLVFLYSTSDLPVVPTGDDQTETPASFAGKMPSFEVPSFRFSFRTSSHKPPEQPDSTKGRSSWYSDWKWLNPFSSSITLDENRSVLPPLPDRQPVYTYYEPQLRKDENSKKIDQEILSTWRRAWWAHGFRPVILGKAEAESNLLYQTKPVSALSEDLKLELNRWLAWGHMGTGLLTTPSCVPMGPNDDPLLSHLRRGHYLAPTRFTGLGNGLFVAEKAQIHDAIKRVLSHPKLSSAETLWEVLKVESSGSEHPKAIAHYDSSTITSKYPALAEKLVADPNGGRLALNTLINSHLHSTWQSSFQQGIAVLKPLPAHTTALIAPSLKLANLLAECPESLMPASCPPNRPKCSPCVSSRIQVTTPATYRNVSSLYYIGTVPHPYTMISLKNQSEAITVRYIRRHMDRDPWLTAVTRGILGTGRGGPSRVVGFKEAIASEYGRGRGLWLATEQLPVVGSTSTEVALPVDWLSEMDWHFGFVIPRTAITHGESLPPVPGPERWPKSKPGLPEERRKSWDPDPPTEKQLATEVDLLSKAKEAVAPTGDRPRSIVRVSEAWNLADTEAWRFARAYQARSLLERANWEKEEKGYGPEGRDKGRWLRK